MEFQEQSNLNLLGLAFLVVMVVLTLSLPRRYALVPLLITTCYMPLGQMIVVAGLHFQFMRVVLLTGWLRIFIKKEHRGLQLTRLDKAFLWWAAATLVIGTLTDPSFNRFINRSGEVYNAIGAYFLMRCWMQDLEDTKRLVRVAGFMILPLALSMLLEKTTGRNMFFVFGGVSEFTEVRDGVLRCQGAFLHPILAGTYAVTLLPLFAGLWFAGREYKMAALVGAASASIATITSGSSGALITLLGVMGGFACWPLRYRMHLIRRGAVLMIIALAIVMKAPVWYLLSRVSEIFGGTGWHRSYLIDQAITHFNEWWLVGSTYTAHWAPGGQVLVSDPNNMDITNHYIAEGLGGGIWKLGLFIAMIVICFKNISHWIWAKESVALNERMFVWSLGVALFAHCLSFISICYFDQIIIMWFWALANCSMLEETRPDDSFVTSSPQPDLI
jgi:hypothetical protein